MVKRFTSHVKWLKIEISEDQEFQATLHYSILMYFDVFWISWSFHVSNEFHTQMDFSTTESLKSMICAHCLRESEFLLLHAIA